MTKLALLMALWFSQGCFLSNTIGHDNSDGTKYCVIVLADKHSIIIPHFCENYVFHFIKFGDIILP